MWQTREILDIQVDHDDALLQQHPLQQQQIVMSAPTNYQPLQRPPQLANLTVDNSSEEEEEDDDAQARTLFCSNLDERVTEEMLFEIFLQAGPLETVRIPKDNYGKQRIFGFVTYVHRCSPPYAIQLFAGLSLFKRRLNIKLQNKPNVRSGSRYSLPSHYNIRRQPIAYNSALRTSSYNALIDAAQAATMNPFRQNSPDWTNDTAHRDQHDKGNERITKHASSYRRPHHNAGPYQRGESSRYRSGGNDSPEYGRRGESPRYGSGGNDSSEYGRRVESSRYGSGGNDSPEYGRRGESSRYGSGGNDSPEYGRRGESSRYRSGGNESPEYGRKCEYRGNCGQQRRGDQRARNRR